MRISRDAIQRSARKGLRRIGLDVANPRSDYASTSTLSRLISRGSVIEQAAACRLILGAAEYAGRGIHAEGQLIQDVLACGGMAGHHYFVEVGAGHPYELSNTATLVHHFGWRGLRVEPNPEFAELHQRVTIPEVTFVCAAVGTDEGQVTPFLVAGELSTRIEHIRSDGHKDLRLQALSSDSVVKVPVKRLDLLLAEVDAPEWIDYLSVDTEGSELDVLQSFPWHERKVGLVTVEHNFDHDRLEAFDRLLSAQGLHRVLSDFSAWDAWYLNEDLCHS